MNRIVTIPYSEVKFKFIGDHYDLHLNGLCKYNGQTCYFNTLVGDWDEDNDCWEESFCHIYELSIKERLNWFLRQRKFEAMVGYHWTYPHRKNGSHFHYRKPKWFYKWLFKIFYKIK